jgi:hypothetical protein
LPSSSSRSRFTYRLDEIRADRTSHQLRLQRLLPDLVTRACLAADECDVLVPALTAVRVESAPHALLAMQKVEGSNPFSRFAKGAHLQVLSML